MLNRLISVNVVAENSWWFTWIVLPFLIMAARASDQALGTMRVVFISKGLKYLAPLVGFIESIIWLLAVSQILQHVNNLFYIVAYGSGYAIGNFIGSTREGKLSLGRVIVRIICTNDSTKLIQALKESNFGFTLVDGHGSKGEVQLICSVINRKHIDEMIAIVNHWNPNAFYSIEEVKTAREGVFKQSTPASLSPSRLLQLGMRKAK